MPQVDILHVCLLDKFIPPFINLIKENFDFDRHSFHLSGDIKQYPVTIRSNVVYLRGPVRTIELLRAMYAARKIILHGMFERRIVKLFALQPWLLRKCYWVMWGGDLYHHKDRSRNYQEDRYEQIRAFVIRRMGHFVTYIKGDYELARQWYGANGQYHECLMYPSNTYNGGSPPLKSDAYINVLIGNSATQTNNHLDIFEAIKPLMHSGVRIYCPLSYGEADYAVMVAAKGRELFGENFITLTDFMPLSKYMELLGRIDIAIFAHNRQQGMGNTINLLGLGKKIFINSHTTQWQFFSNLGIHIFDLDKLDLEPMRENDSIENRNTISQHCSLDNMLKQYKEIFC